MQALCLYEEGEIVCVKQKQGGGGVAGRRRRW